MRGRGEIKEAGPVVCVCCRIEWREPGLRGVRGPGAKRRPMDDGLNDARGASSRSRAVWKGGGERQQPFKFDGKRLHLGETPAVGAISYSIQGLDFLFI
jgi:hypothetical protein